MDSVDSGMLPGGHVPAHWYDTWDRQASQSFSTTTKGLRNAPGENNCFLNSAVQVFWHIDVFRRSYRRLSGHLCMGHSCIFCALKVIFTQFQYSDQSSLQPSALRKALANTFAKQERFQLGHMDDAAECFENILHRIHYHLASNHNEDTCNAPHCIPHQKFAMTVCDQLVCPCGSKSEPLRFHELVHYISANALVSQTRTMQESGDILHPNRFGLLLRNARAFGDVRDCPDTCGKRVQIRRSLLNVPDVVSVGLVWGSDKPDIELTTEVARAIGTTLLLPDLFHSVMHDVSKLPRLQLTSVVCYYGKHYSTFVYHTKLSSWVYFDDATVREVGPHFENVVEKIARSRYQPLLLIYSNLNAQPVPTETAPSTRVMAPGYSMTPTKEESKPISKDQGGTSKKSLGPQLDKEGNPINSEDKEHPVGRKSSFEHRRQSSFLLAVTKQKYKDENVYAVPNNNTKIAGMQKDLRADMQQNNVKTNPAPGYYGDIPDGPEDPDSYNYTLSTSDQYRRPGLSSPDPTKLPLTPNFSRATEAQRKESFKKGKGKVGADVIRYHVDGSRRASVSSESDPGSPIREVPKTQGGSMKVKPVLPEKPKHVRTRSQSLEDNMANVGESGNNVAPHKVVKPTPSMNYENVDISRAHTPVQVGIATLPRNKKGAAKGPNGVSSTASSSSMTMPAMSMSEGGHPGSQFTMATSQSMFPQESPPPPYTANPSHTGYQNCLSYQNVVDTDHHSRQSSSSSILSQNTVVECGFSDDNIEVSHIRQSSTVSTDTLTETKPPKEPKSKSKRKDKDENSKKKEQRREEKKQKSKKDKSSQGSVRSTDSQAKKSGTHQDEGFSDDQFYIDPRMVESVLSFQKLQRSGSCVSQASTSSVESDSYKGRPIVPKDNLSSEIPFDAASLDSHKDSGYGSSDRNSSSSTGSVTMNPYEQYFVSRSMIPPKTFNPQVMAENMRLLMDNGSGMKGLEYTTEKDLKSLVTGPIEQYKQSNTVAYVQQHQQQVQPNLQFNKDLRNMTKEERDQLLYDALSGHKKIPGAQQPPYNIQAGNHPHQQHGYQQGCNQNEKGIPYTQDNQSRPTTDISSHEAAQEQFIRLCQQAENLMDSCVLAETSSQFADAQSHCQQAINVLQGAMKLPNIGQKSFTFAQHMSNSCLLKYRSLQKRLMNRQESNSSTASSENNFSQDSRRTQPGQLKHPQHQQLSQLSSRSGSQNSVDSLKDGSTSSGSGRSTTPVFDKVSRMPTDERVPPIHGPVAPPSGEFHNGMSKDRSFETNPQDGNMTSNADLYGTLPRRKTHKSQDHVRMCNNLKHEADVYQDFLENQRRQTGAPSRPISGSQTPVNECSDQFVNQSVPPPSTGRQFSLHSLTANVPYNQQMGGVNRPNRAAGLVQVPVTPPAIGNQLNQTEVCNDLGRCAPNSDWLHSTNQSQRVVHGDGGNQLYRLNYSLARQKPQNSQVPVASQVRNGNVAVSQLFASSTCIQTAFSSPSQPTSSPDPSLVTCAGDGGSSATVSTSTVARFPSGGPNRYRSIERRKQLDRSSSFSHPARPPTYTQTLSRQADKDIPFVAGRLSTGLSQPDLRQLSGETSCVPQQRPLTPQVLCSESSSQDAEETRQLSVQDLKSRFESSRISTDNVNKVVNSGKQSDTKGTHPQLAPVQSVQSFMPEHEYRVPLQRQRSKSESESLAQQPPRPKSALSKRNRFGPSTKPRKSVTFSDNICLVAAVDNCVPGMDPDYVTQAGYQSDEEDRSDFTARCQDDDDSSSSSSPVELAVNGLCSLCHKHGVEMGQHYCPKCTFYMSRFTPAR